MTEVLRLQADPETDDAEESPGGVPYVSAMSVAASCREAPPT